MSSIEYAEWYAYSLYQPFGEAREDERAGAIASAISNVYRKKGSKPRGWLDFFPPYEKRQPVSGWQDLLSKVIGVNRKLGGIDERE